MTLQLDPAVLAAHLETLAQAASQVARDLRSGVANLGGSMACSSGGPSGEPPVNPNGGQALIDSKALADMLGIGVRTLRRWRHEGRVPKPMRGKGPLRWSRAAVDRWIKERTS